MMRQAKNILTRRAMSWILLSLAPGVNQTKRAPVYSFASGVFQYNKTSLHHEAGRFQLSLERRGLSFFALQNALDPCVTWLTAFFMGDAIKQPGCLRVAPDFRMVRYGAALAMKLQLEFETAGCCITFEPGAINSKGFET